MSSSKWNGRFVSCSPSTFAPSQYAALRGKRSILVPSEVDINGRFALSRKESEFDLYELLLVVRVVEGSPVIRSVTFGLIQYGENTERYKFAQFEPSITDFDLRAIKLQSYAARLIAKVSLTNKLDVKYIDDYNEFRRQASKGVHGIAFGDKPKPIFTDTNGVAWYKVFTYDSLDTASKAIGNTRRRTAARPTNKQVAQAYKDAKSQGLAVEPYLENLFNAPKKSVQRWIKEAKVAGLIPKTKAGRPRKVGKV